LSDKDVKSVVSLDLSGTMIFSHPIL